VCCTLLFWNIFEGYDTEIELDIRGDEEGDIILSEEEKMKRKEKIEEKKLSQTDYAKLQQLRATQEANRREIDYGLTNAYSFSPNSGRGGEELDREYSYKVEQSPD
jgi:hypothetical protein